jgi:hypothetical protein
MVRQVTRAQGSPRIKNYREAGVAGSAKTEADMGKAVVNTDRHGPQGRNRTDLVLAGANEERKILDSLSRARSGCVILRFGLDRSWVTRLIVVLLCHPGRRIPASAATSAKRSCAAKIGWVTSRGQVIMTGGGTIGQFLATIGMVFGWPGSTVELGVEIAVKVSDGIAVMLHWAGAENVIRTTAAKTATKFSREVTKRNARCRA